jgi:hypothetical protein
MNIAMCRTTSLLSLSLVLTTVWAEDAGAPPSTAPAPAPAPSTEVAAPAPAATNAEPAPVKAEDMVFAPNPRRVRPARTPVTKPFTIGVQLSSGYDSNILLENSDTPTATNAKGLAVTGEVRGNVRIVDNARGRLGAFASFEADGYPGNSQANLMRYGGGLTASTSVGGFDPGLVVGYNRFFIDSDLAATALNINAYVAKVFESQVAVLGAASQYVDYADNEPITGTLYDVSYRHWFLLEPKRIWRRIELAIKAGKNRTQADDEAYTVLTPAVAGLYRFGAVPEAGTQDLSARLQYEMRRYPDPSAGGSGEDQKQFSVTAGYDYWLATWVSAGLYAGYSKRSSTEEANRYDRKQGGLRLTATW